MTIKSREGAPPTRVPRRSRVAARLCWRFSRDAWQHPLTSVALLLIAVRLVMISIAHLEADAPFASLLIVLISLLLNARLELVLILGFGIAFLISGPFRRPVYLLYVSFCGITMVLGAIDVLLNRHLGHRLTPQLLLTYCNDWAVGSDVWGPLIFDWTFTVLVVAALSIGLFLLIKRVRADWPRLSFSPSVLPALLWVAFLAYGTACLSQANHRNWGYMDYLVRPVERDFLRRPAHAATPPPADEESAIAALRSFVPLSPDDEWLGGDYPLVRRPRFAPAAPNQDFENLPDIYLLIIECLSGRDSGLFIPGVDENLKIPNLRRLARRGVTFTRFLANGFPTVEGSFAIESSAWPHARRANMVASTATKFDSIPARLGDLGYKRIAFWGCNPAWDNQLPWARQRYDEIRFYGSDGFEEIDRLVRYVKNRGYLELSDAELFRRVIARVSEHHRTEPRRPLFFRVANLNTHAPFDVVQSSTFTPAQRAEALSFGAPDQLNLNRRYQNALAYYDLQLGKLISYLEQTGRWERSIIIVVGDHGVWKSEKVDAHLRSLPLDPVVWTGAIISGPRRWIGPTPRVADFPASQVDLLPTINRLVGDRRPYASLGSDLLDDRFPVEKRLAMAIAPGGIRLDWHPGTYFIRSDATDHMFVLPSFDRRYSYQLRDGQEVPQVDRPRMEHLHRAMQTWSWLIEQNRVWDDALYESLARDNSHE